MSEKRATMSARSTHLNIYHNAREQCRTPFSGVLVEVRGRSCRRWLQLPATAASPMGCARPCSPETSDRSSCSRLELGRNTDWRSLAGAAMTPLHTNSCIASKQLNITTSPCVGSSIQTPCGFGLKDRPARFLDGCHKRWLNQACVSTIILYWPRFLLSFFLIFTLIILHYFVSVFCFLVVLVRLSVRAQVIDWKDSSPKWPITCWWETLKPCSLAHYIAVGFWQWSTSYWSIHTTRSFPTSDSVTVLLK